MNYECNENRTDFGPDPYVMSVPQSAIQNQNFRKAVWSGCHLQMTLMCIPVCEDIGLERHESTDQILRVEGGRAIVKMSSCRSYVEFQRELCQGDTVFIPAGTWHNIMNAGGCPLKISSVYAPPNHPHGTIQRTKEEAEKEAY